MLFDAAVIWLLVSKVLLPGLSVLERDIARVRTRVAAHVHRRLVARLTPEQRTGSIRSSRLPATDGKVRWIAYVTGHRVGQEDQLGALGLVVNLIVLWNTIYIDAALDQLRAEGGRFRLRAE